MSTTSRCTQILLACWTITAATGWACSSRTAPATRHAPQLPAQPEPQVRLAPDPRAEPTAQLEAVPPEARDAGVRAGRAAAAVLAAGKSIDPVDPRRLQALLPPASGPLKRRSVKAESTGGAGFSVSLAEAEYAAEGTEGPALSPAKRLLLRLTDTVGVGGLAGPGAAWLPVVAPVETGLGYERPMTFAGRQGSEKFETRSRSGEVQLNVADRFLVEISGSGVTPEELKAWLGKIDLERLARLQQEEPEQ